MKFKDITMTKKWYTSKTVIVGILETLVGIGGLLAEWLANADYTEASITLLVTGILTIILRRITSQPIA